MCVRKLSFCFSLVCLVLHFVQEQNPKRHEFAAAPESFSSRRAQSPPPQHVESDATRPATSSQRQGGSGHEAPTTARREEIDQLLRTLLRSARPRNKHAASDASVVSDVSENSGDSDDSYDSDDSDEAPIVSRGVRTDEGRDSYESLSDGGGGSDGGDGKVTVPARVLRGLLRVVSGLLGSALQGGAPARRGALARVERELS